MGPFVPALKSMPVSLLPTLAVFGGWLFGLGFGLCGCCFGCVLALGKRYDANRA